MVDLGMTTPFGCSHNIQFAGGNARMMTNVASDQVTTMRTVNKLVFVGLLLTGLIFFASFGLGFQGGILSQASYFLGYVLVLYSVVAFLWSGLS